ncbi:MAG: hypothetical protein ACRDOB_10175, partial [Streptosporangiaceae bacterium]
MDDKDADRPDSQLSGVPAGQFACSDPAEQRLPIPDCGLEYSAVRQDGIANEDHAVPLGDFKA